MADSVVYDTFNNSFSCICVHIYIILDGLEGIQEYIARDVLASSSTREILLVSRPIYSCIPRKRAIRYYYFYLYRVLCVILLPYDHE